MQNLKVDFEKWLIHVKKYKTLPNGKSHSADFYKSKINKVCKNFYHCKDIINFHSFDFVKRSCR